MEELRGFLVIVFGLAIAIVFSILVMIHGWGLEPKSWGWIIGINLAAHFTAQIFIEIGKHKPKE